MKYAVVSGNRADRAALYPVAEAVKADWIYVDTLPSRNQFDSAISCSQAMAMAAEKYAELKPDMVILPGDRFEILGAACAAHLMSIPIAHLSGGDITEGSQDNSMRHAITKLASLHFPTNQESADNLAAMGEDKWRIHMVGAPQIDYLLQQELYSKEDTFKRLELSGEDNFVLVAYQPLTLTENIITYELDKLLKDLHWQGWPCIFTTINNDAGRDAIEISIIQFCQRGKNRRIVKMDNKLYLSAIKHCTYMVGNSSSGFYEAPTLGTLFQNIGDRQKGRKAMRGDGKAAQRIKATLEAMATVPRETLLKKRGVECLSTNPGNVSTTNGGGGATPTRGWSAIYSDGRVYDTDRGYLTLDQDRDLVRGF